MTASDTKSLLAMDEPAHNEHHRIHRASWMRAAVLGANDGIVSTAALVVGVASAAASTGQIFVAGVAALVAGSMSMAAGEYVSVSSQSDIERADMDMERKALAEHPEQELAELAKIYVDRGLTPELASKVARQLTAHDALGAHARDELGISDTAKARPVQAAWTSATSFALGASLPLGAAIAAPEDQVTTIVAIVSLLALAFLGLISARAGGANQGRAVVRTVFWGAAAMLITGIVGSLTAPILGHI